MTRRSSRFTSDARPATILAVLLTVLASLFLAACSPQHSAPQQVQAENPSVTYKYRGDQELLQANQNAMTFCSQYHSVAQTANITDSSDGYKTVVFECVSTAPATVSTTQPLSSNLAYDYRTDQELLDASRNAQIYCTSKGSQRAMGTVVTNVDGTRTVTFQCVP